MPTSIPTNTYGNKITSPWWEFVSKSGFVGDISAGPSGMTAVMVIDIPWGNLKNTIAEVLGYPAGALGFNINRITPMTHPLFPWLRAVKITSIKGVKWKEREDKPDGGGSISSYFMARLTVAFETLPYHCLENIECPKEYYRYVVRLPVPSSETISKDKGSSTWAAGVPDGAGGVMTNKDIQTKVSRIVNKVRYQWRWMHVPNAFLFGGDYQPANLIAAMSRVNADSWPPGGGNPFRKGTLLMEAPSLEPIMLPIDPFKLGIANANAPPLVWNVTVNMLQHEPELDGGYNGYTEYGHNLQPHPVLPYWYPIVAKSGGSPNIPSTDFDKFWQAVS